MKIYIGADHAGNALKEEIKKLLSRKGIRYEDLGGNGDREDDYPIFGERVAKAVTKDRNSRGILACGTGIGMAIVANKIKGVRAALVHDEYSAEMSRKDDDANVLVLRARRMPLKKNLEIIKAWLEADFSGEERHKRRIKEISALEKRSFR